MMRTMANMTERVAEWVRESPIDDQVDFLNCPREDLIKYHHSLGRTIRNEFALWEVKWTPVMVNGADNSPHHPDAVSMTIIQEVWDALNESN